MYASSSKNVTPGLLRSALDFFFPSPCLACSEAFPPTPRSLGLCARCRGQLTRWPCDRCDLCGGTFADVQEAAEGRCLVCRRQPPAYRRLLSAWSYKPPLDAVLAGLKFRRLEYLGAQLGQVVADRFRHELTDCDLVVPVPLHWRRYLHRGYNQAAAIARPIAAELGLPVTSALRRRRATPAQSRLSRRQRRHNLDGAFAVSAGLFRSIFSGCFSCQGRRILLVDDVATTGATLQAAAACLQKAGAMAVIALTVARTPEPANVG